MAGEPHLLPDHSHEVVLASLREGPIQESALAEDEGVFGNVDVGQKTGGKAVAIEKHLGVELGHEAPISHPQRGQIHESSDQAAAALQMRKHPRAARAAREGIGPTVRQQHAA